MSRRKQAALPVPASQTEAAELCTEYVQDERRMLELRLGYELQIDKLKAERDVVLTGIAARQQHRFAALKAWWEAGGRGLAGRNRSAELAGAKIGIRTTPPAVKFARGVKADDIIVWLKKVRWSKASQLLRTKVELDKQAIIRCVADNQGEEDMLADQGVTVVQIDEFYIDCGLDEAAIRQRLGAAEPTQLPAL